MVPTHASLALRTCATLALLVALAPGCSSDSTTASNADTGGGRDIGVDAAPIDSGTDTGADVATDAPTDTAADTGLDATPDADPDATADADATEGQCGDGVVDDGEQCDVGEANGTEGEPCTLECIVDADRDGADAASDCDDNDPMRSPDFDEICNGIDDNCDGDVDVDPVDVEACPLPRIETFEVSRARVPVDATISLTWEVTDADTVELSSDPAIEGLGAVDLMDEALVAVTEDTVFTLTATNPSGQATAEQIVTVVDTLVIVEPAFDVDTLPDATWGMPWTYAFLSEGGAPPVAWSIEGDLPAGLEINADSGELSGTPETVGTSTFDVVALDALDPPQDVRRTLTLTVVAPALTTEGGTLPAGVVGEAYDAPLAASGGLPPLSWAPSDGALPDGLAVDAAGRVTGTPTAAGDFTVEITVSDSMDPAQTAAASFTLRIEPPAPAIDGAPLTEPREGVAYSATPTVTGGTPALTWSATDLPAGLGIDAATGMVMGTPTTAGAFTATISVEDAIGRTDDYTWDAEVAPPTPSITTTELPRGLVDAAYTAALTAEGGRAPLAFAITDGSLPSGLSLSAAGALSGTPTLAGTSTFEVTVTDADGVTATADLAIAVDAVLEPVTDALPPGVVGVAYDQVVTATGGLRPLTWERTGSLPPGLEMTPSGDDARISGTPTTRGTYPFALRVTDSRDPEQLVTIPLSIRIDPVPPTITTAALPPANLGTPYARAVEATGGAAPLAWEATGLPAGLSINPTTGAISGTPTENGVFAVTVTVTDALDRIDDAVLSLTVNGDAPSISTASLPPGIVGTPYSVTLAGSGSATPLVWSAPSGLPGGLTLSTAGVLSGTPTSETSTSVLIRLTDNIGLTDEVALDLDIFAALAITTPATLPPAGVGSPYAQTLAATGGVAPRTWTLDATSAPFAVSIAADGSLSFTATSAGTFTIDARVVDDAAPPQVATRRFTVNVAPAPPTITTASLANGEVGTAYSATLAATDGAPPLVWSVLSGALPDGLTLNADGTVTGTPTTEGSSSFTARVTDALGRTDDQALSITITAPPVTGYDGVLGSYMDISATGTVLDISDTDDGTSDAVAIGFPFTFYGTEYTEIFVNTNGTVNFSDEYASTSNTNLPSASNADNLIAVFWDDLDPGDNGEIYVQTFGTAPSRYTVIQWHEVDFFSGDGSTINAQAVLYETSNLVQLLYGTSITGTTTGGRATGGGATAGIENADGTIGVELSFDDPQGIRPGQVWLLRPTAPTTYETTSWGAQTGTFEDISATGTSIATLVGDDDGEVIPIGFNFTFYGATNTTVGVSSNGYLTFGADTTDFSNDTIPTATDPNALIAVFWDDLRVRTAGDVRYQVVGAAPNRQLIVQWTNAELLSDADSRLTFQAALYETSNRIELRYASMYSDLAGRAAGTSATIGVENADGTAGRIASYNSRAIQPGSVVSIVPYTSAAADYAVTPASAPIFEDIRLTGTLLAAGAASDDGSEAVDMGFATSFFGGSYTTAYVSSNGFVTFANVGASSLGNTDLPSAATPNALVAGFWDDLDPADAPEGSGVFTQTRGVAPNREFVVQYTNVPFFSPQPSSLTYQIIIRENGTSDVVWADMSSPSSPERAQGSSVTVGVENADGTDGTRSSYNETMLVRPGQFVRYLAR